MDRRIERAIDWLQRHCAVSRTVYTKRTYPNATAWVYLIEREAKPTLYFCFDVPKQTIKRICV